MVLATGSGGGDEHAAGLVLHAPDHGFQAVRALRRQVLLELQLSEDGEGIAVDDLGSGLVGVEGDEDGNEPLDDVGVAVADKMDDAALGLRLQPDLADAALDLVLGVRWSSPGAPACGRAR